MSPIPLFPFLLLTSLSLAAAQQRCEPGFFHTLSGNCLPCPPGTAQPLAGQNSCVPCLDTEIAKRASRKCTPCPVDEIADRSKTECVCKIGTARDYDADFPQCQLCRPGTFNYRPNHAVPSCNRCRPGTFQPKSGQLECQACPRGTLSDSGAKACQEYPPGLIETGRSRGSCPVGESNVPFLTKCRLCYKGSFNPIEGVGPCLPCPPLSVSRRGAAECIGCPPGQAVIGRIQNATCGICPPGTYYSSSRKCLPCPPNSFQPYENVRSACFTCATNEFAKEGAKKCVRCDSEQGLMRNGRCARCNINFYYNRNSFSCVKCEFNSFSTGAVRDVCPQCPTCSPCRPCTTCPIGTLLREGTTRCELCPPGHAAMKDGKCGQCPPGMEYHSYNGGCSRCFGGIQPVPNIMEYCHECPYGMRPNRERTECVPR